MNIFDALANLDPEIAAIIKLPYCAQLTVSQRSILDIRLSVGRVLIRVFQEGRLNAPSAATFCSLDVAKQKINDARNGIAGPGKYEVNFRPIEEFFSREAEDIGN